jgi:hypothetical protein
MYSQNLGSAEVKCWQRILTVDFQTKQFCKRSKRQCKSKFLHYKVWKLIWVLFVVWGVELTAPPPRVRQVRTSWFFFLRGGVERRSYFAKSIRRIYRRTRAWHIKEKTNKSCETWEQSSIKYHLTNEIREQIDEYSEPFRVKLKSNRLTVAVSAAVAHTRNKAGFTITRFFA